MTTDFRLVVHTTERHSHILAIESIGNRLSERSFTHSRRAVEADNRRFHVFAQLEHSKVLDDAVFDIFKSVMVFIELVLNLFEVEIILGIYTPREIEESVEIGVLHRVVGRLRMNTLQFAHFLFESGSSGFVPIFLFGASAQFIKILVGTGISKFVLDSANLLLQEMLTLLLREVFSSLILDFRLDFNELSFFREVGSERHSTFLDVDSFEQRSLHFGIKREVGADEINEVNRVLDVLDSKQHLLAIIAEVLKHTDGSVAHSTKDSCKLAVFGFRLHFGVGTHRACEIWRSV